MKALLIIRDTENQYNGTELSNLVYGLFPVTLPIFFMIGKFIRIFFLNLFETIGRVGPMYVDGKNIRL